MLLSHAQISEHEAHHHEKRHSLLWEEEKEKRLFLKFSGFPLFSSSCTLCDTSSSNSLLENISLKVRVKKTKKELAKSKQLNTKMVIAFFGF